MTNREDTKLTYEEAYKEHLAGKPMLVFCGASWCAPCKKMKELLEDMKRRGDLDNVAVAYIDIDERPDLFEKIKNGDSVPQVHYFVKGRRLTLKGIQDRLRMRRLLRELK